MRCACKPAKVRDGRHDRIAEAQEFLCGQGHEDAPQARAVNSRELPGAGALAPDFAWSRGSASGAFNSQTCALRYQGGRRADAARHSFR